VANTGADERLLRALAEQIKLPLVQIASMAELGNPNSLESIAHITEAALSLVDGFLLSSQRAEQETLELEPVSLSSVLMETSHQLDFWAKQNNCDIEVRLAGKYVPVMAHQKSLRSALLLLGYSLIEARAVERRRHRVVLAAHRNPHGGLVAGVFDNQPGISADAFRRGRALYGSARQPIPGLGGANGAGVFIADALLRTMAAPLRVARHNNLTGLAGTFHPSSQLQFVS